MMPYGSPQHPPACAEKKFVIESVAEEFAGIGIAVLAAVAAVAAAAPVLSIQGYYTE
jgi:hypothetical protein